MWIMILACEKSITVPLEKTFYEPKLMIFGSASPLSGAQVIIRFSEPIAGIDSIPELSDFEVAISSEKGREYNLREDSTGYFSLPGDSILLNPEESYQLRVTNLSTGEMHTSSTVQLPETPKISEVSLDVDTSTRTSLVHTTLGEVKSVIEALSFSVSRLDSTKRDLENRKFKTRIQGPNIIYPDQEIWRSKKFSQQINNFVRTEDGGIIKAYYIDVVVTFFSEDLARFARDINETNYYGEDIFQLVRPVYSNIEEGHGIFGLFNEASVRLKLIN